MISFLTFLGSVVLALFLITLGVIILACLISFLCYVIAGIIRVITGNTKDK